MNKHFLSLLFFVLFVKVVFSQYSFNDNCKNAWMLLMDLKVKEAKSLMAKEIARNPTNYYAYYLDQTCDAFTILINSNDEEYENFLESYDRKRDTMDDKYEESPYYLMCKSEMDLQLGFFKVMHESQFSGVRSSYLGYREVYKNIELHPDFMPSRMIDGFFNTALSNLPPFLKSTVSVFGVTTNFSYGMKTLAKVYKSQKAIKGMNAYSALFLIFSAKINKSPELVYDFVHSLDDEIKDLFVLKYFRGNIEYRTGHNEMAYRTISSLNYNNSSYARILYDYMMGKILLRKLDPKAGYYLESYLKRLKKKEYFKEMTYKLALFYLINGNRNKYDELCEVVISEGAELNERDREALYDASLDYQPDIRLVKAKLLLEGGYYSRGKEQLDLFKDKSNPELPYLLEFHLLNGKYMFRTGNKEEAVRMLKWVVEKGEDEDYYFACEAALVLGEIYEAAGELELALEYYKLSDDLYESEYYEYLGAKARKGIYRLKEQAEAEH